MAIISVIVPIYNAERYLSCCIDSILAQTFSDFELILVNDGSKDLSAEICDNYAKKDNRITVIHKTNEGVSKARNTGINKANGNYLVFIDSDDFVDNKYLEALYEGRDADLSYIGIKRYNWITQNVDSTIYKFFKSKLIIHPETNDMKKIIDNNLLAIGFPWGKMFKKDIINRYNIRFIENLKNHEDHLFCYDYLLHCKYIYLSDIVAYNYTYSPNSESLTHTTPSYSTLLLASDEFMKRYPNLLQHFNISIDDQYSHCITSEYGIGTRRAAVYSLYYHNEPRNVRLKFLKEQGYMFRKLYAQYGYQPSTRKHLLIFKLVGCKWLCPHMKDFILKSIYHRNI